MRQTYTLTGRRRIDPPRLYPPLIEAPRRRRNYRAEAATWLAFVLLMAAAFLTAWMLRG